MKIVEMYSVAWDGVHKRIDQYQIVDSLETAKLLANKWIEKFFPEDRFDITKTDLESGDCIYEYKSKTPNPGGYFDDGIIKIYEPTPLTKSDIEEKFKPWEPDPNRFYQVVNTENEEVSSVIDENGKVQIWKV